MESPVISCALGIGLLLLGTRAWWRSRRANRRIGESTKNLLFGFWIPAAFTSYGCYAVIAVSGVLKM